MTVSTWAIREGDVLDALREMPSESVHCVVTSPPYWGLRDYGTAAWDGGDPACGHADSAEVIERAAVAASTLGGGKANQANAESSRRHRPTCGRCGARRVDQQLGLEATPDEYLARMVAVFREVRRVLRSDGTCWVNMGDSYAGDPGKGGSGTPTDKNNRGENYPTHRFKEKLGGGHDAGVRAFGAGATGQGDAEESVLRDVPAGTPTGGLKPKDLIGMPWMLAFALRADGWWLRSEIIWAKPNPMPESVTDRPTKAHEQIFLFAKAARYYYDADAIREPMTESTAKRYESGWAGDEQRGFPSGPQNHFSKFMGSDRARDSVAAGRNARSVWSIATQPYAEAHFATFPEELPKRCILAGTSEKGVCGGSVPKLHLRSDLTEEQAARVAGFLAKKGAV